MLPCWLSTPFIVEMLSTDMLIVESKASNPLLLLWGYLFAPSGEIHIQDSYSGTWIFC